MIDNRNLILAVVISISILLAFEAFFEGPRREKMLEEQQAQQAAQLAEQGEVPQAQIGEVPTAPGTAPAPVEGVGSGMSRDDALAESARVAIDTPKLQGSIALTGGRIDDLTLTSYRETIDPESAMIDLLEPIGSARPYYAGFGWTSGDRSLEVPNASTVWQADGDRLTPDRPVTLSWTNAQGVRFEQEISVDPEYMFSITQRVINESGGAVSVSPYGLVSRTGRPDTFDFFILHEGLIGVFDEILEEESYDDVEEDKAFNFESTGGWTGITDKYWQVVVIPDQSERVSARFIYGDKSQPAKYQTDILYEGAIVPSGSTLERSSRLFAGAKVVETLDAYRDADLPVVRFDDSVDFGWFHFLTKPFFHMLNWFANLLGNFGLAILAVTIIVKIVFFPLANKSYRSMAKMRKLQPEMLQLRERFGDDKQRLNQEMMGLYKREGANPLSGCLPILVQIPVFFALYKVLFVSIEMRHAPFYGWIHDLSAPDPTTILNLFGLLPWGAPELGLLNILNIGVWPILMGTTMYLQHMLNPQPPDPIQAKIFKFMPIMFTFLLAQFAAGLVIYWTWNNLLSIIQQYVIMKRAGVPIGPRANAAAAAASALAPGGGGKPKQDKDKPEEDEQSDHAEEAVQASSGDSGDEEKKDYKGSRKARRRKRKSQNQAGGADRGDRPN